MTAQLGLFDGKALKNAGIKRVASHNEEWLAYTRDVARDYATATGVVDADVLRRLAGHAQPDHPNAWGAVFKSGEFEPCGWKASTTPSCHGRMIRVWRLKCKF